ncbi:G patch domain and ankyrin repeat-containing protein 1 [Betta splendens]|uniref:G patch domain and ankyrin repeat-containing protein 1 n=1 Tax=Betta splendens TaxID=158456 RepID=A0A6P7MZT3_BETSP|nr:G patch domain and ankyrin repeat-containing protein 1 [Betta splendens]
MATLGFTPASQQDVFCIETEQSRCKPTSVLSGEEARLFYENVTDCDKKRCASSGAIIKTVNGRERRQRSTVCSRRRRRVRTETHQDQRDSLVQRGVGEGEGGPRGESSSSERLKEFQGLRLLRCAHEGDVSGVKELLTKAVNINFQDTFFWTAMMCASWSGQRAVVRLLLERGAAWVGVVDTQGRDARDLAVEAGHGDVLEELDGWGTSTQRDTQTDSSTPQPEWCSVCCSEYHGSLSSHHSSTLHQFSLRRPPPTPYYCLPPSSKSYKMMVRCGWKPGTGLGPEGVGPKQPVPTVLKRDQKGLGYGQTKRAKVTHFQARDHDAVELPFKDKEERLGKGKRKEEGRLKEQRDKNWERDFRASFYL